VNLRAFKELLAIWIPFSLRFRTFSAVCAAVRHQRAWRRSLQPGRNPLDDELPWISFPAIDLLERRLSPQTRVFEYGAGGSTVFFARRAKSVISVEHDPAWFERVSAHMTKRDLRTWEGRLISPEYCPSGPGDPADPRAFASSDERYRRLSFRSYVEAIDAFADDSFDLVLVDGRARPACLLHAAPKVRPHGLLVLDNADREHYQPALRELRRDFFIRNLPGPAPCYSGPVTTAVLRRLR
jgi:SAM-dependent methyltransferase